MSDTLEHSARRIAERGRDELVSRLRPAFQEATQAHADVLELGPEQVEQMVQRAADRADGLQWRRALASVATDELGIGLGQALSHPAVARAHAIVGAPSYEDSLAELGAVPKTAAEQVEEPGEAEVEEFDEESDEDAPLRIAAIHLGGIANLTPAESGLELRFSPHGLDIARGESEVLGRLAWQEITALEVPASRGWPRRKRTATHLVVRAPAGDASFEVPALSAEELREHLAPLIERHMSS